MTSPSDRWPTALVPLAEPVFRMLWLAWLAANVCMWMNDVAAAWLMTQLTSDPLLVALVQAASTLPVFLLGLPSGAMADIVDRRRYFAFTQLWVAVVALVLAASALAGVLSAHSLLLLTFCNGIGLAMRWPVFAAILPDIVSRPQLSSALALNAIAMNGSRIIGPLLAGLLLSTLGSPAVFAFNALMSLVAFALILRWKSVPRSSALPGERFVGAMRVGLQHVRQSPSVRAALIRVFLFFLQSSAVMSLLPLLAQRMKGGAGGFTLLLACLGAGAIFAALMINRVREQYTRDHVVRLGTLVQALTTLAMAWAPSLWIAAPVMMLCGMAWISTANTLTMSAQLALPNWVRARGMSIYQMGLMGGSALGAALWGQTASLVGVPAALMAAAALAPVCLLLTRRLSIQPQVEPDLRPAQPAAQPSPAVPIEADEGPVMVTVEYHVRAADLEAFARVMALTRAARLRQGALSWGLFRDTEVPGRHVEYFVDETWVEHLRRHERFTTDDVELRQQRLALHAGDASPVVRRYIGMSLDGRPL
ncbi:putative MFS family arabinose efflux permease [Sphaerotilus hippei]|uniref:Putative MFS family arabinose efflux permease n=1 Tax=Sphaerotilus hippei TaxID=744406 RepID=A0A318HFV2_9BURK|nr:MFS transporter [Sphaerotilus hippei]PXW98779.1 putative MFS family arabinose efflux permease [Sphaerotilus hippei]